MKRLLFQLLITITFTNLAGGYAIAASALSKASAETIHFSGHTGDHKIKKSTYDLQVLQVNKEESEEDELIPACPTIVVGGANYRFSPEFGKVNKHFLVHYGTSIKEKQPAIYLMLQNFRI